MQRYEDFLNPQTFIEISANWQLAGKVGKKAGCQLVRFGSAKVRFFSGPAIPGSFTKRILLVEGEGAGENLLWKERVQKPAFFLPVILYVIG